METTWISEAGEVIIRLIEAGGDKAIAALLWYLAYLIIRILTIGGVVCLVIYQLASGIQGFLDSHSERKRQHITLLSEEVSKRWEEQLKSTLSGLSNAAMRLSGHLDELKKDSTTSSEKQQETSKAKSE